MTRMLELAVTNRSNQDGELYNVSVNGVNKTLAVGETWKPNITADADGNYAVSMEADAVRALPEAKLFDLRAALRPEVLAKLAELGEAENIIRELAGFPPVERAQAEPEAEPEVFDPGFPEDDGMEAA